MKDFLKNKVLIILFLFILLTITLFSNVFAYDISYDNNTYNFTTNFPEDFFGYHYIITKSSSQIAGKDYFSVIYSKTDLTVSFNSSYTFYSDTTIWSQAGFSDTQFLCDESHTYSGGTNGTYTYIISASENIFNTEGDLVFQVAPLGVEPMKIQQVEEIPLMMEKIIKMILPVCLIIFGTLLVIYLIKSKNLLQL